MLHALSWPSEIDPRLTARSSLRVATPGDRARSRPGSTADLDTPVYDAGHVLIAVLADTFPVPSLLEPVNGGCLRAG
jgi:hypothetical protein